MPRDATARHMRNFSRAVSPTALESLARRPRRSSGLSLVQGGGHSSSELRDRPFRAGAGVGARRGGSGASLRARRRAAPTSSPTAFTLDRAYLERRFAED